MKRTKIIYTAFFMLAGILATGCTKDTSVSKNNELMTNLKVEIFERGDVPAGAGTVTNNAMTNWVQNEFGDPNNITMEYYSIPRAEETSQLNILMAANEAPDIVLTYSYGSLYDYYMKGGLLNLSSYMDNAPELKAFLGDEVLNEGKINGEQYMIPSKRLIRGRMAQLVRQDWLDKIDMTVPTNTDEFYNMLKAFKESDPGGVGVKNIPFGMSVHIPMIEEIIRTFIDPNITAKDRTCIPAVMQPGYKDGLRFMNDLYNQGLISADFALDKDRKQFESDISNGYVGFFVDDLGRPLQHGNVNEALKKNVPGAKLAAVDTWTNSAGQRSKESYSSVGLYMAVPKASEQKGDAVIKYLNWMANKDVLQTLQYGFEGQTYTIGTDGLPQVIETDEASKIHWYTLGFDLALIVNGKYNADMDKCIEMAAVATNDKELYIDCYNNSMTDTWVAKILPPDISDNAAMGVSLSEKRSEIIIKSIMAPAGQFDSVFDSLLAEYDNIGGSKQMEINYTLYQQAYGE